MYSILNDISSIWWCGDIQYFSEQVHCYSDQIKALGYIKMSVYLFFTVSGGLSVHTHVLFTHCEIFKIYGFGELVQYLFSNDLPPVRRQTLT